MRLITESICQTQYGDTLENVFRKVNIYNSRERRCLNEGKYNEILFSLNEQEAIRGMFALIQTKILENYYGSSLNEGFLDSVKSTVSNAANAVKQTAVNIADKIQQLPGKLKMAYEFCEKIIKAGISKVSQLIKVLISLFEKLGDTIRDAIEKLGGFGSNEISSVELGDAKALTSFISQNSVEPIKLDEENFKQFPVPEKEFVEALCEYVYKNSTNKQILEPINENIFGTIADKISQNKVA